MRFKNDYLDLSGYSDAFLGVSITGGVYLSMFSFLKKLLNGHTLQRL
jgi:hypothetical protein